MGCCVASQDYGFRRWTRINSLPDNLSFVFFVPLYTVCQESAKRSSWDHRLHSLTNR